MLDESILSDTARKVFDRMEEGIAIVDASGKFTYWNNSAKQIIGHVENDLPLDQWPLEYKSYDDEGNPFSYADLPLAKALKGEEVSDVPITIRKKNDKGIHLYCTALPITDGAKVTGAVCIFSDVIDIERAGEAVMTLRLINKELRDRLQ